MGDEYFGLGRKFNLRDRDVLTVGPVVAELGRSFDAYWNGAWAVPFEVVAQDIPTEEAEAVLSSARSWLPQATLPYPIQSSRPDLEQALERTIAGLVWARVEVHYDRPDAHPDDADGSGFERVQKALTRLVAEAKRELLIQTPYFVPRDVGIKTIVEAARAGVAIRIMTNSLASTDEVSAQAIYATLRSEMLANGVRMFELKPDAGIRPLYSPPDHDVDAVLGLHAKSIVADREVLYIGTFNVDARSAALNTEIALIIYSPELAGQVADTIERDMRPENSWEVVLDESGATSWIERRGDEVVRHSAPPRTSVGRRMRAGLLSILPIDSQL